MAIDREVLISIKIELKKAALEALREGLKEVQAELQAMATASQATVPASKAAAGGVQALAVAVGAAKVAAQQFASVLRGVLAGGLQVVLAPLRLLRGAFSELWGILKIGFGVAAGRALVAFFTDPIGALQDLEQSIFGLTSELSVLREQLEIMLPESMGSASEAMDRLVDMVARTPAPFEDLRR